MKTTWKAIWGISWRLLALSSLFRIVFLAFYHAYFLEIPINFIWLGLSHGVCFDASIVGLFLAFSSIGIVLTRFLALLKPVLYAWLFLFTFLYLSLLTCDLVYFASSRQRLGYEVFAYLNRSFFPIFMSGFKAFPFSVIISGILFAVVGLRFCNMLAMAKPSRWLITPLLITLIVCVVLIRGGFQRVPLRVSDSFISKYPMVNLLAMNPVFLAIRAEDSTVKRFFTSDIAEKITLDTLNIKKIKELPEDLKKYPLLHCLPVSDSAKPKNCHYFDGILVSKIC